MSGLFLLLFLPYFHGAPIPESEVLQYLSKYGYTKPPQLADSEVRSFQDTKTDGLIALQESLGLKQTGVLDKDTVEEMQKPRCGMKYQDPASLRGSGGIVRDYPKWKKTNLRYKLRPLDEKRKRNSTKISAKDTLAAIQAGFKMWSEVTPLKFERVASFASRDKYDIEVKFMKGEHGDGSAFDGLGGELAHAFYPPTGKLHIDDDENFLFSNYSKLSKVKPYNYVDLLYVAVHESGHLLGLDHSNNSASIMYPTYSPKFDKNGKYILPKLGKIDIEAIQQIYGKNPGSPKTTTAASTTARGRAAKEYHTTTSVPHLTHAATKPSTPLPMKIPNVDPETGCPYAIDAYVHRSFNPDSVSLIFVGQYVMYLSRQPPYFHLIKDVFPNGPETVDLATMANFDPGFLVIIKDRKVYGYLEDYHNSVPGYRLAEGYPKTLSTDVNFDIEGIAPGVNQTVMLFSNEETNTVVNYDYALNVVLEAFFRNDGLFTPTGISWNGLNADEAIVYYTRNNLYIILDDHAKPDATIPISKAFGRCPEGIDEEREDPEVDPDTGCPYTIDSFVRPSHDLQSVPLVFTGRHVMYQSKQPPYFHLITDVFPNAPDTVDTATMADREVGLVMLIKGRKIYGYFELFVNGVLHYTKADGFPKELPADVDFDVEGATGGSSHGRLILLSNKETNKQYTYDYESNKVTYKRVRQSEDWYVPPGVRTFIWDKGRGSRGARYEMFTKTHAYIYLDGHSKPDKSYPISKAFGSCPTLNVLS